MHTSIDLPRPPVATRDRGQLEAFLVLRRNPLELWGARAYTEQVIPGRFLGRPQLLVSAPEAIRHVLVTNAEAYRRSPATRRVLAPIIGEGLFLAEGAAWRHQRRTVAPALAPRAVSLLARHVVTAALAFTATLAAVAHRPLVLMPRLQALALGIAGQSMFSLEMDRDAARLRGLLTRYALRHARPDLFDLLLPAGRMSPLDRGRAVFRAEWAAFIDGLIAARAAPAGEARDLFDLLAAARDPETGQGFSPAQLRDEVATLIVAGHETTAVTLFWACYALARLPQAQERLAAEAAPVDLSATEPVAALPGIRAFVDETLRLYPPAFMIVREASTADRIDGRRVVPGTAVIIAPFVLHRHRAHWAEPERFDPDRFAQGAPAKFTYLPFGAGPRICVGAQFALTEAVLVLAALLQRFRIEICGGGAVMPVGLVTIQPDRDVEFLLTPRA